MATPLVVSVAAMVRALRPDLSAQQVRDLLVESATPLNLPSEQVGTGRLDAYAALRRALHSDLTLLTDSYFVQGPIGVSSIPLSVRLENASLTTACVECQCDQRQPLDFAGYGGDTDVSGTAYYGAPSFLQIILSPAQLPAGEHNGSVRFLAISSNGDQISRELRIRMLVNPDSQQVTVNGFANITAASR